MKACLFPKLVNGSYHPCHNCRHCRRLRKQIWASRLILESYFYPRSLFVTLTYRDDTVPLDNDGVPQLHKPHVTSFLEKFRYLTRNNQPVRYFAVGEYGEETWRPHYHLVLFGHGVEVAPLIEKAWAPKYSDEPRGFQQLGELTLQRAMYIANYCVKKMTKEGDPWLKGRMPEFARMSRTPPLGTPAIGWLADAMGRTHLAENGEYTPILRLQGDVFNTVRIDGKIMPLGQTMRRKLRDALGLSQNQRERAIQLGRYDHQTGEIYEDILSQEFYPNQDLTDARTPLFQENARLIQKAKTNIAHQHNEKDLRQGVLFKTGRQV